MCSRYFVDDQTKQEIERLLACLNEAQCMDDTRLPRFSAKDMHPADEAVVIRASKRGIVCDLQKWGLPGFQQNQLLINARSETVTQKSVFREGILKRRIVVPAAGFYEWNKNKEKNVFRRPDGHAIFMAGFSERYEDGEHFVILTTDANHSMRPVHDRMPLILEENDIPIWLLDDKRMGTFLQKVPAELERNSDYEQLSFFM